MKTRMNFKDEFYQKLKLLVLPIAIQNFMLALVSATDAIMLGWIDQTSLSAVSLAGQVQFVLSLLSQASRRAPVLWQRSTGETGCRFDRKSDSDRTSHQPAVLRPVYHPCRFLSRNADAHLYK